MSKIDKKRDKLKERITSLENEVKDTLQKKSQGTSINIQDYRTKILELKKELSDLK